MQLLTRASLVILLVTVSGAAQVLDISIRPDVIYTEPLGGDIVPAHRVFFHILLHNVSDVPVDIQWVRFDLVGSTGGIVSGQFSGPALEALFDDSIDRRRIETTAKGTLTVGPDVRKAISDVFLDLPSGFMGQTLVVESEFLAGDSPLTSQVSVPVKAAEGFVGRLPFEGIWYVSAEHGIQDAHKRFIAEAYAYDFLQIGPDGSSYGGRGSRNSDFFAYGRPVLAAGDGEVVYMRNDVPENVPGQAMPATPGGNAIVIRHADDQYTYYAHMRPSGMKVGVGDQVVAGDPIGEVGNSGDSTEPHLHFHAMTGRDPGDSDGLPVLFESWTSEAYGRKAARRTLGTIPRGDFVSP
jgi:murein DD-endopeptidase MepM/ murein hydrolase activator NlpD